MRARRDSRLFKTNVLSRRLDDFRRRRLQINVAARNFSYVCDFFHVCVCRRFGPRKTRNFE